MPVDLYLMTFTHHEHRESGRLRLASSCGESFLAGNRHRKKTQKKPPGVVANITFKITCWDSYIQTNAVNQP